MSMKKRIAKLQKGQALVRQGQQAAQMVQQVAGMPGGLSGGRAGGGIAGSTDGFVSGAQSAAGGQGLAARAASGQGRQRPERRNQSPAKSRCHVRRRRGCRRRPLSSPTST